MADEIHALNKNEIQDIDYDTYFGEMDLSDEEKEDRKKLAEKFEKIFVMLFALLSGKEEAEITTITKEFIIRYESIATQYCKAKRTPSYITDYARYIVNEVVDATTQNIEVEYFTSQKRAKNVAANEANAVGNYRLQTDMVKQGYKTKEWRSKEDSHVRPTHADVDRKRIDIFEPFEVGNSLMMFPKDHSLGAEVSGLLTALISFGNRKQIVEKAQELDDMFQGNPAKWITDKQFEEDIPYNSKSFYRTISNAKFISWCYLLYWMLISKYGGSTIEKFVNTRAKIEEMSAFHVLKDMFYSTPNTSAKRIAMFMRWMVRNDGIVDLGLWKTVNSKDLIIPLDTHVHTMALELGITKRKTTDIKTAMEITDYFKTIWPHDPCLGDFALFGYGVNNK